MTTCKDKARPLSARDGPPANLAVARFLADQKASLVTLRPCSASARNTVRLPLGIALAAGTASITKRCDRTATAAAATPYTSPSRFSSKPSGRLPWRGRNLLKLCRAQLILLDIFAHPHQVAEGFVRTRPRLWRAGAKAPAPSGRTHCRFIYKTTNPR